jgi:hypothetical protein
VLRVSTPLPPPPLTCSPLVVTLTGRPLPAPLGVWHTMAACVQVWITHAADPTSTFPGLTPNDAPVTVSASPPLVAMVRLSWPFTRRAVMTGGPYPKETGLAFRPATLTTRGLLAVGKSTAGGLQVMVVCVLVGLEHGRPAMVTVADPAGPKFCPGRNVS